VDKYVVDAGPLIHLDQIGQLRLLEKLPSLFIPTSVFMEIRHDTNSADLKTIRKWPHAKIVAVGKPGLKSLNPFIKRFSLQRGETDCIHLAFDLRPCTFLTDDLAARIAAEKLSIEVHGTVGIIAYAFRQRWLSLNQAEEALNRLYCQSSLFITYAIIENAILRLRETG